MRCVLYPRTPPVGIRLFNACYDRFGPVPLVHIFPPPPWSLNSPPLPPLFPPLSPPYRTIFALLLSTAPRSCVFSDMQPDIAHPTFTVLFPFIFPSPLSSLPPLPPPQPHLSNDTNLPPFGRRSARFYHDTWTLVNLGAAPGRTKSVPRPDSKHRQFPMGATSFSPPVYRCPLDPHGAFFFRTLAYFLSTATFPLSLTNFR